MPTATVFPGSTLTISSGQTSSFLDVLQGGTLDVLSGGVVISTALQGTEVLLGGTDTAATVTSGGTQIVSAGGTVSGGTISLGANQAVLAGGLALDVLATGGRQTVSSGGVVSGTIVSQDGFDNDGLIISGGLSIAATVSSGGGIGVGGVIAVGQATPVIGGASGTVVSAGGLIDVGIGGITTGTVLATGSATEELYSGGIASNTIINAGAAEDVNAGGNAYAAIVLSGGVQFIQGDVPFGSLGEPIPGGTALDDAVSSGGTVIDNGILYYAEAAGSISTFAGTLLGSGMLVQSGPGTLTLSGSLAGFTGLASIVGGTLELASAGAAGDATIGFVNVSALAQTLKVDGSVGPLTTISNFNADDTIDLAGLSFGNTAAPSVSGNTVIVTEGNTTESLLIDGASNDSFALLSDGAAGTYLRIACYCSGTLILNVRGETPVQDLQIGDTVVVGSGERRPIRWIGRRSYVGRFLAANPSVQPIRFCPGSLGEDLPRRDLLVSPEHAMFLDGLLVPARCLVNGSTIVQERALPRVDYFHIELDSHDVLLAEGAPSESFVDDDSRGMFHNASEYAALYPGAPMPGSFCAPKVDEGYQLEAIRRRLAALAGEIAAAA